jgi:hypothetical protein
MLPFRLLLRLPSLPLRLHPTDRHSSDIGKAAFGRLF